MTPKAGVVPSSAQHLVGVVLETVLLVGVVRISLIDSVGYDGHYCHNTHSLVVYEDVYILVFIWCLWSLYVFWGWYRKLTVFDVVALWECRSARLRGGSGACYCAAAERPGFLLPDERKARRPG